MKCADIPDQAVLDAVKRCLRPYGFATRWDVQREFPGVPEKLMLAKFRKLIRKEKMDGCCCGCRGDFELKNSFRKIRF